MILKNKLTRETLEITYSEFRKKFVKEIRTAFESYCRTQLNKYSYNLKMIILWIQFLLPITMELQSLWKFQLVY